MKEVELGRGNRMRKDLNYDDQLSEREWLKAIGVLTYDTFVKNQLPKQLLSAG